MRKTEANKVKVGDTLYVLRKHWYFIGRGVAVEFVKVVEVISKDAEGNLPLFKVEADAMGWDFDTTFSYLFFEAIYHEGDSRCDKCHKIGSFVDGTLYGNHEELIDGASFGRYDALCNSCLNEINN